MPTEGLLCCQNLASITQLTTPARIENAWGAALLPLRRNAGELWVLQFPAQCYAAASGAMAHQDGRSIFEPPHNAAQHT
jgi:hypothetical protein